MVRLAGAARADDARVLDIGSNSAQLQVFEARPGSSYGKDASGSAPARQIPAAAKRPAPPGNRRSKCWRRPARPGPVLDTGAWLEGVLRARERDRHRD